MTSSGQAHCYHIVACRDVAATPTQDFLGRRLVRSVQARGNEFELIPTVKMETRYPVERSLGILNFRRPIIMELWRHEVAFATLGKNAIFAFF